MSDEVQPITIRFPLTLVEALRQRAQAERRSFNAQVIWLLQRAITEQEGYDDDKSREVAK